MFEKIKDIRWKEGMDKEESRNLLPDRASGVRAGKSLQSWPADTQHVAS
jgi:hypothetical protein